MIWYKINQRWWIDITQVRAFGKHKDFTDVITVQWKDGNEDNFSVDDADEELINFEEFVQQMFEPLKAIIPEEGELPFGLV